MHVPSFNTFMHLLFPALGGYVGWTFGKLCRDVTAIRKEVEKWRRI